MPKDVRMFAFGPFRLFPAQWLLLEGDVPVRIGRWDRKEDGRTPGRGQCILQKRSRVIESLRTRTVLYEIRHADFTS